MGNIVDYREILDRKGLRREIEDVFKEAIKQYHKPNNPEDKVLFEFYPKLGIYTMNGVTAYLFIKDNYIVDADMNQFKEDILNYANGFNIGYNAIYLKPSIGNYNIEYIFDEIAKFTLPTPQKIDYEGNTVNRTWRDYGQRVGRYYAAWCMLLENQSKFVPFIDINKCESSLSMREIALIYAYKQERITDRIGNGILAEFKSKGLYRNEIKLKSGEILAREFLKVEKPSKRIDSTVRTANAIEKIIKYLPQEYKTLAFKELEQAKINQQNKKEN